MDKLAVILASALIGFLLYWRGSILYRRVVMGESLSAELHVLLVGMYGLSAGLLFISLLLLLSYQAPEFIWDGESILGMVSVAGILGLVVAVVTAARLLAVRRMLR